MLTSLCLEVFTTSFTSTDPCREVLERYEDVRMGVAKILNSIAPWVFQVLDFHLKMKLGRDFVALLIESPKEFYEALAKIYGKLGAEMLIKVFDKKLRELKLVESPIQTLTYIIEYNGNKEEICKLLLKIVEKAKEQHKTP